jgi:hypothetical protein
MKPLKLLVTVNADYDTSYSDFVGYWKEQYSYPNSHWYYDNINLTKYNHHNICDLFCWKNGMNLSHPKQLVVNSIALKLDFVNQLKQQYDEDFFVREFGYLSAIWQVFLRHIIQPAQFPIFDQHVYRAFRYLQRQEKDEIPNNKVLKLKIYFEQYLAFYLDMEENTELFTGKEIDDALWAFGKFLGNHPKMFL